MKEEGIAHILVPLRLGDMRRELSLSVVWYNRHRLHQALGGRIPSAVYSGTRDEPLHFDPRNEGATEPRLIVTYFDDRKHLPVVELRQAA